MISLSVYISNSMLKCPIFVLKVRFWFAWQLRKRSAIWCNWRSFLLKFVNEKNIFGCWRSGIERGLSLFYGKFCGAEGNGNSD